jgi:hypothetical protein
MGKRGAVRTQNPGQRLPTPFRCLSRANNSNDSWSNARGLPASSQAKSWRGCGGRAPTLAAAMEEGGNVKRGNGKDDDCVDPRTGCYLEADVAGTVYCPMCGHANEFRMEATNLATVRCGRCGGSFECSFTLFRDDAGRA